MRLEAGTEGVEVNEGLEGNLKSGDFALFASFAIFASFALFVAAAPAAAQMPDPKQMSGMPLPVGDIAAGTITVRVIRGQLTNPLPGQTVELTGAGETRRARTDEAGWGQVWAGPARGRGQGGVAA